MKTDHPIYQFLSTGAEAFRVLTGGRELSGPYEFCSLTLKGIERRLDGIFEPQGHAGTVYVVEFQAQYKPAAWYNLLTKVGLYGERYPKKDVQGILIFLRERDDPCLPHGAGGSASPVTAVYLERFLPKLLESEPDNPFAAVFAPLIITSDVELRARGPALWRTIKMAPLALPVRQSLLEILEYWFFERFSVLGAEEILSMLKVLTPLEETRAYQEIFAKGEARGEARGEAKLLTKLLIHRFGTLSKVLEARMAQASTVQLEKWGERVLDATTLEEVFSSDLKTDDTLN